MVAKVDVTMQKRALDNNEKIAIEGKNKMTVCNQLQFNHTNIGVFWLFCRFGWVILQIHPHESAEKWPDSVG